MSASSPLPLTNESPLSPLREISRNSGEQIARRRADGCVTQIHDNVLAGAALSPQFYCAYRSIQATRISPGAWLEILRCSTFTTANHQLPLSHLFADAAAAVSQHLAAASSCPSFSSVFFHLSPTVEFNPRTGIAIISASLLGFIWSC